MEAVKEFTTDHQKHLKAAMDKLVGSGVDDGFVIFETDEGKFLQFTYSRGDGLTFDLSRMGLTEGEVERVTHLEGLEAMTETEMSYLMQVGVDTRMGARIADSVFRKVFRCSKNYRIQATIDIEA